MLWKKVFIARQEKNNIPEADEVSEKEKIENKNKKFTIWWFLDKKLCVKGELFVVAKVFFPGVKRAAAANFPLILCEFLFSLKS